MLDMQLVYDPVAAGEVVLLNGARPACYDVEALELLLVMTHAQLAELHIHRRQTDATDQPDGEASLLHDHQTYAYIRDRYRRCHDITSRKEFSIRLSVVDGQLERLAAVKDHFANALALRAYTAHDPTNAATASWLAGEAIKSAIKSLNKRSLEARINAKLDPLDSIRASMRKSFEQMGEELGAIQPAGRRPPTADECTWVRDRLDPSIDLTASLLIDDASRRWGPEELPDRVHRFAKRSYHVLVPAEYIDRHSDVDIQPSRSPLFWTYEELLHGLGLPFIDRSQTEKVAAPPRPVDIVMPLELQRHEALVTEFKHAAQLWERIEALGRACDELASRHDPAMLKFRIHWTSASEGWRCFMAVIVAVFFRRTYEHTADGAERFLQFAKDCRFGRWDLVENFLRAASLIQENNTSHDRYIPPLDLIATAQDTAKRLRELVSTPPNANPPQER
jgi:hypothetical protein